MSKNYTEIEIIGLKKNRLTAIKYVETNKHRKRIFQFACECGNITKAVVSDFLNGHTKSCGCLFRETSAKKMKKFRHLGEGNRLRHGMTNSSEYSTWRTMKARCYNKKTESFKSYGARGIKVCKSWLDSFDNFFADMGPKPTNKHVLDRINVNGNYSPENCRWATQHDSDRNKRTNKYLTYNGETLIESDWCKRLGLKSRNAISKRIASGWPTDLAFTLGPIERKLRKKINKS